MIKTDEQIIVDAVTEARAWVDGVGQELTIGRTAYALVTLFDRCEALERFVKDVKSMLDRGTTCTDTAEYFAILRHDYAALAPATEKQHG